MRITTGMMAAKYLRNLNKSESNMNRSSEQVSSGRKFFRGSEDPVGAIKAYKLRREYRKTETYDTNITDADSVLTVAESNLTEISDNIETAYTSTLRGITGTMSAEDREVIAKQLDYLQESMLSAMNSKIEDKYVFGGTSRAEIPFTLDDNGNLLYKGFDVMTGINPVTGVTADLNVLAKETVNIDLGLGIETDGGSGVKDSTVFDMSLAGIKFLGYGKDESGIPNNLYTLIGEIKGMLRSKEFSADSIEVYTDKFIEEKQNVMIGITEIGAKSTYIDFLGQRNLDYQDNLTERIKSVEYVDTAEAATDFALQEYSYNAALSMGNKILQKSFIDFMD